jgi:chitinase
VTIEAAAGDADGNVVRVEFYAGATKIGEDTQAPFSLTWTGAPVGSHSLTAVAIDDRGASTVSAVRVVEVQAGTGAGSCPAPR